MGHISMVGYLHYFRIEAMVTRTDMYGAQTKNGKIALTRESLATAWLQVFLPMIWIKCHSLGSIQDKRSKCFSLEEWLECRSIKSTMLLNPFSDMLSLRIKYIDINASDIYNNFLRIYSKYFLNIFLISKLKCS